MSVFCNIGEKFSQMTDVSIVSMIINWLFWTWIATFVGKSFVGLVN